MIFPARKEFVAVAKRKLTEIAQLTLIESMPDSVLVVDVKGKIINVNAQTEAIFGYRREALLGQPVEMLLPERNRAIHPQHRVEYFAAPKVRSMGSGLVLYGRRQDGSEFPVDVSLSAIDTAKGPEAIAVVRDITEQLRAKQHIESQLRRLTALRNIDLAITGSVDLPLVLAVILEQATSQLGIDAASVLLLTPDSKFLTFGAGRGFRTTAIEQIHVKLDVGLVGKVVRKRQLIHVTNLSMEGFTRSGLMEDEGFVEYYAAPLIVKGKVNGLLEVFHRAALETDDEWRSFLQLLAGEAAIAIDNSHLFEELQNSTHELILANDATIEGWSRALDLRDQDTEGHTSRVTQLVVQLARAMGTSEEELTHIRRGALLHDIGKMGVPDGILLKPGKLTAEEWLIMRKHPQYAFDLLSPIKFLKPALAIPYCHHEKWDGSGYPRGLKGDQIPLPARIFAVVDVWDALRSDRPYRPKWTDEETLAYIKQQSGKHFDPYVVASFEKIIAGGR